MTNEKLLEHIEYWTSGGNRQPTPAYEWTQEDEEALAQLRAMLHEPPDEEREEMLEDFEYILGVSGLPESDWTPKIRRALIKAPKPSADDVDRLVAAAWKVLDLYGEGGYTNLRLALAPFKKEVKE